MIYQPLSKPWAKADRFLAWKLWKRTKGGLVPHQGAQECARRLKQIQRGILTPSNGLVA